MTVTTLKKLDAGPYQFAKRSYLQETGFLLLSEDHDQLPLNWSTVTRVQIGDLRKNHFMNSWRQPKASFPCDS